MADPLGDLVEPEGSSNGADGINLEHSAADGTADREILLAGFGSDDEGTPGTDGGLRADETVSPAVADGEPRRMDLDSPEGVGERGLEAAGWRRDKTPSSPTPPAPANHGSDDGTAVDSSTLADSYITVDGEDTVAAGPSVPAAGQPPLTPPPTHPRYARHTPINIRVSI